MTDQCLLITGAAGGVGSLMRPRMARTGRTLRLLDIADIAQGDDNAERIRASVTDMAAMEQACTGADALIHLGGLSVEYPWQQILDINIHGTYVALEAARRQGVRRVVLASSNHAIGFHSTHHGEVGAGAFPRPDTNYGVSKVAMEALGSMYADRYGMDVIAIRLGSCFEKPKDARMLRTWLSPDDGARLFEACLSAPSPGFRVVWGASRNTRHWVSLHEAEALGYRPQDDSEIFAEEVLANGEPDPDNTLMSYIGGAWCGPEWNTAEKEQAEEEQA